MIMPPLFPTPPVLTSLKISLPPEMVTFSVAFISTALASPCPKTLALISPSSSISKVGVLMIMPPLFPTPPVLTLLKISLPPEIVTFSVAFISIPSASPTPKVLALSCAPSWREREAVSMVMPPEFPSAPEPTWLNMPLRDPWLPPDRVTNSEAVMEIPPPLPFPPGFIPDKI